VTPPNVLDTLASVGLDDVVGTARLLTRIDRKYVVPVEALPGIIEQLDLPVLEIEGRRRFSYESVYFDTPDRITYVAAAHSRRRRVKVRTRTYVDSSLCMLELKSKGYRDQTVKTRVDYDIAERSVLNAQALTFLADRTDAFNNQHLAAALTTRYERSTLADLGDGSRVTIDTGLVCLDTSGRMAAMPGYAIVETKSTNGSCPSDRLLWKAGYRPDTLSKYGVGMAALSPELPRNKWHRVIRRHVAVSDRTTP
jgi:VTC domain